MGITIDSIQNDEHFEYKGDVHVTGSIGKRATIIIKDGELTVDGNVGDITEITLTQELSSSSIVIGSMFMNNVSIVGVNTSKNVHIKGDVGNGVILNSHNASFLIEGSVGDSCAFKTHNGDISTGMIGSNNSLVTHNGYINSGSVGKKSSLKTHNGNVNAGDMAKNSEATSHNSDVRVTHAHETVTLKSHNGHVYENGVKRQKEKTRHQGGINMSFVGGGRIIVNGKDITNLVDDASRSRGDEEQQEKEPVRYKKKGH